MTEDINTPKLPDGVPEDFLSLKPKISFGGKLWLVDTGICDQFKESILAPSPIIDDVPWPEPTLEGYVAGSTILTQVRAQALYSLVPFSTPVTGALHYLYDDCVNSSRSKIWNWGETWVQDRGYGACPVSGFIRGLTIAQSEQILKELIIVWNIFLQVPPLAERAQCLIEIAQKILETGITKPYTRAIVNSEFGKYLNDKNSDILYELQSEPIVTNILFKNSLQSIVEIVEELGTGNIIFTNDVFGINSNNPLEVLARIMTYQQKDEMINKNLFYFMGINLEFSEAIKKAKENPIKENEIKTYIKAFTAQAIRAGQYENVCKLGNSLTQIANINSGAISPELFTSSAFEVCKTIADDINLTSKNSLNKTNYLFPTHKKTGTKEFGKKDVVRVDEDPMALLNALVGLKSIKEQVERLRSEVKVQQKRKEMGFGEVGKSNHMVFLGSPGTAKTTVARTIAQIYKSLGVLKSGHIIEVSRSDLIGMYRGETAQNVVKAVERAIGGVLFIDEAYLLADKADEKSHGYEAIGTLSKLMEDRRGEFIVIAAGYQAEMRNLLNTNPGFTSRFGSTISFPDYKLDELTEIFNHMLKSTNFEVDPTGAERVKKILDQKRKKKNFGNGRDVRTLFENSVGNQASRLCKLNDFSKEVLMKLEAEDISGVEVKHGTEFTSEAAGEIEELIGLETIKKQVKRLFDEAKIRHERELKGLPTVPISRHMVFAGNPGTAKTTVARIIGQVYADLGYVSNGQLVEVGKADLQGQWLGQTAPKVVDAFERARGGILFIDEAYMLNQVSSRDTYSTEALGTIVKYMEDYRDEMIVIAAGYTDEMEKFLEQNPGLRSRFGHTLTFPDYTESELIDIMKFFALKSGYVIDENAFPKITNYLSKLQTKPNFANGRAVRNLFEEMVTRQAERLAQNNNIDEADLSIILSSDVPNDDEIEEGYLPAGYI